MSIKNKSKENQLKLIKQNFDQSIFILIIYNFCLIGKGRRRRSLRRLRQS